MGISEERAVQLVGGAIAAVSAPVLVVSLFADWVRSGACVPGLCVAHSGWDVLQVGRVILLASAAAGIVVLAALRWAPTWRVLAQTVAGAVALGGALLVVHHASGMLVPAAVPVEASVGPGVGSALRAGPFIALVACFGVAGGGWLAAIATRVFDRAAWAPVGLAGAACGALAIIVALWLPWVRRELILEAAAPAPALSAWQAAPSLSLLLLLGAMAILGGVLIAAVVRWRAVFLALALAGWLEAAFALAVAPHLGGFIGAQLLAGVYVVAGGAALIGLGGVAAAMG